MLGRILAMLLYATLGVCALAAVCLVCRYDMYDREPWCMVVLAVLLGMGIMWVAVHALAPQSTVSVPARTD